MTQTASLSNGALSPVQPKGEHSAGVAASSKAAARQPADPHAKTTIHRSMYWIAALVVIALGQFMVSRYDWVAKYPSDWILPIKEWIDAFFEWLVYGIRFFEGASLEFTPRDVTRGVSALLKYPLALTESLFFDGFSKSIPALPWITVVGFATILGHWLGGWRTALLAAVAFTYLALFGVWQASMQTFSLVLITVPMVFLLGLVAGILMSKSPRFKSLITPLFDVLQSMPPFAYLVPIVVLYGVGNVPAMIATALFAVPPVARCISLGLSGVNKGVIEAGQMMGCTRRQLLWQVQIPAARSALLVGLNQGVMQTLAMIVLAALIGAAGLGSELLTSLQSLRLGQALEQGIAIVVIAVVLDRLSRAYALKEPVYVDPSLSWWRRHPYMSLALGFLLLSISMASLLPELMLLTDKYSITTAPYWNAGIDWINLHWYEPVQAFRNFALMEILIPTRNFFQAIPWPTFVLLVVLLGCRLGGWKVAVIAGLLVWFPAATGLWHEAMTTLYMIGTAAIVCISTGFVIGLLASRTAAWSRFASGVCDFFQTFPSFIYLIPVVMLFKVSDLSAIIAVLLFAVVPMIRYTILGLRGVPAHIIEAATQQGTTPRQRLLKVELPIALPEIMLGVNQVIFMALFMVAITALIGTQDLGAEINAARSGNEIGKALVAGLCIAFMGIAADRLIGAWVKRKKIQLGLTA
ncbi:ABC transporter permease [Pollutimonas harenae]|uniref:ABC transporter permease subunit n=1 Tax=Pollutimonas harenae TaxID=657015 RepID=A0A853H9T3_9BURK|nr:ABC transporter permease subunit [Pollutimonas harenae]NYT86784.1 ABC transporter permease subunit [Pollutimonas harenae]TEA71432.1 ABC transporter permease subunit [Pollutimonas harenae]